MSTRKLQLSEIFNALDRKDYEWYNNLPDDKKKEFQGFVQLRFASGAEGSSDLEQYCILATNKYVNIDFWSISKYPDLVWKCLCAANPGIGKYKRSYLKLNQPKKNKRQQFLEKEFPAMKEEDIVLWAEICSDKELKELARDLGYQDSEIKRRI